MFDSDGTANPADLKGAFVDQVVLTVRFIQKLYMPFIRRDPTPTATPTNTPTPTPTATVIPTTYTDVFDNSNSGWVTRRQNNDSPSNFVRYVNGKLELEVDKPNDFVLAAPMVAATEGGYKIETQAALISPKDQQGYGIAFAGNWNGQACPNANYSSCFTSFYWLEVRWLANNNNPLLVFRLTRVTGHSGDNTPQGITLINWKEVKVVNGVTINPNAINEWDVRYEADGDIFIFVANQQVGTVRDTTYLGNRYFGLTASTINDAGPSNADAKAQFEYLSIVPVP
jgi:hypothetical protein